MVTTKCISYSNGNGHWLLIIIKKTITLKTASFTLNHKTNITITPNGLESKSVMKNTNLKIRLTLNTIMLALVPLLKTYYK